VAWLNDHPPESPQFRHPRRERESGTVVVHTAENTPDYVAFDGGAEAVANFIRTRNDPGSYHDLVDSDSGIWLVDYGDEAFHDATGSNRWSVGISVATRADVWGLAPAAWRAGAIHQLAYVASRYARRLRAMRGITIPARRITRAQSEARAPGFISHAERDPARRRDPGALFPWHDFLTKFAVMLGQPTPPPIPPAPNLGSVNVNVPVLKQGSRGGAVRSLQALLVEKASKTIATDGIFGPATDAAVRQHQKFLGMKVDGIVGQNTWGSLFL
jgi:Putative peptidoglycan binding domain/N-acetylmuramoyl-L-alanine amidase